MCLTIKSGPHIAKKDFYTLKMFKYIGGSLFSYYRNKQYNLKELNISVLQPYIGEINIGIHSLVLNKNLSNSDWLCQSYGSYDDKVIVLCKIPKTQLIIRG